MGTMQFRTMEVVFNYFKNCLKHDSNAEIAKDIYGCFPRQLTPVQFGRMLNRRPPLNWPVDVPFYLGDHKASNIVRRNFFNDMCLLQFCLKCLQTKVLLEFNLFKRMSRYGHPIQDDTMELMTATVGCLRRMFKTVLLNNHRHPRTSEFDYRVDMSLRISWGNELAGLKYALYEDCTLLIAITDNILDDLIACQVSSKILLQMSKYTRMYHFLVDTLHVADADDDDMACIERLYTISEVARIRTPQTNA